MRNYVSNTATITEIEFDILDILRQIKRLSQDRNDIMPEAGDKLWRLADSAQQKLEGEA